ncbi:hypothetical protein [Novipirellula aureliae]|uniref:hypothetical protein n=1 Tax=Novipirellula aureliae TaxID=2527966 RepID=UPI0018CEA31B|nr:hypothetical protein [Novipirellula aureliae]
MRKTLISIAKHQTFRWQIRIEPPMLNDLAYQSLRLSISRDNLDAIRSRCDVCTCVTLF